LAFSVLKNGCIERTAQPDIPPPAKKGHLAAAFSLILKKNDSIIICPHFAATRFTRVMQTRQAINNEDVSNRYRDYSGDADGIVSDRANFH
jgi:hypothetical protein